MIRLLALAAALWVAAVLAGDQRVAGDALKVGQLYRIEQAGVRSLNVPGNPMFGVIRLAGWKIIKVYERREVEGELWYWTKAITMQTLNPRDHIWGWIAAADLMARGVSRVE